MGFLSCSIQSNDSEEITLRDLRPIILSGSKGVFARHLPSLADDDGEWSLSAEELARFAVPDGSAQSILFDLASNPSACQMLYRLVRVRGRTVSLITDALFHFKVLKPQSNARYEKSGKTEDADWMEGADRYEQLRLEGGKIGGTWLWGESLTSVCATQL